MSILNDQFQGGIDPLQNHRDLGFLETRQTRYAARVVDYDQRGMPVVDPGSVGDVLCASHWGEASRSIGGWAHAWPVKGGSPVQSTNHSNTERVQNIAKNAAKASGSVLGRGGGYVKNKDGSISAYLQIGIGLDPGGFDTLGGTGRDRTFGLPNGYFFGIDAQFAGLGGNYELVIYDGPTGVVKKKSAGAAGGAAGAGAGGVAPAGQHNGAFGPLGAGGAAGASAFGPGGAFGGSGRVVTGESSAGGVIRLRPIKNSGYSPDPAFGTGTVNVPAGWPSIVEGSVGTLLAGTEHKKQEPVYLHGDPRMVSVNAGPDPGASSMVYDTDSTGGFDFNRKARMHSAWRVLPPFSGSPAWGPGGSIAWQLTGAERDSVAGHGAVIDTSSTGGAKRPQSTTPSTQSSSAPSSALYAQAAAAAALAKSAKANGQYLNAGQYAALAAFTKAQAQAIDKKGASPQQASANAGARAGVVAGVPALTVGLSSARSGGFIEVGHGTKDKHVLGKTGDHNINAAHISTDALFYNDVEYDAPLHFEENPYPEVGSFPLKAKVHLQYNGQKFHSPSAQSAGASNGVSRAGQKYKGLWEWWAEVPNTKEGGGDEPPPYPTPTPTPPPTEVYHLDILKRVTIGGIPVLSIDQGFATPLASVSGGGGGGGVGAWGGGAAGGSGAGSYDLPTELPNGRFLASVAHQGHGGMYQAVDKVESFVRVPGSTIERDQTAMTAPTLPQSRLDTVRARAGVTERTDQFSGFPAATAHTVLLFRPQHTHRGYRDLRSSVSAPEAMIRAQMADRPVTLRAEAFGKEYGQTWVKTQDRGESRFDGGTGNGGIVYLPPELDLLDIDRTTYLPTTSTSYLVAHPGVYWASGYARVGSGDVKTGYRWGTGSTGILTFSSLNASGAATTAFGGDASGRLFFRETGGGTTLTVGAIADGEVLTRSGGSVVGATPASMSTLVYSDGSKPVGNTIANTATRTAFTSAHTIPAGSLVAGDLIRICGRGFHSTTGTPTLAIQVEVDGIVALALGPFTCASGASGLGWSFQVDGVVTAIGVSGTIEINGEGSLATSATTALHSHGANIGALSTDTTATIDVDVYAEWGSASASNTTTLHTLTVEIIPQA